MPDIKPIQRRLDDQIEQAASRDGIEPATLTLAPEEIAKWREAQSAPTGELVYRGVPIVDDNDPESVDAAQARRDLALDKLAEISDEIYATAADVDQASKLASFAATPGERVEVIPPAPRRDSPDVGKTGRVKVQK